MDEKHPNILIHKEIILQNLNIRQHGVNIPKFVTT